MKEENYPTKERSTSQVNADVGCTINMRCLCSCQKDWNCFIFGSDERKEHLLGEKICRVIYWFSVLQMGFTPIQLIFYSFKKIILVPRMLVTNRFLFKMSKCKLRLSFVNNQAENPLTNSTTFTSEKFLDIICLNGHEFESSR